MNCWWHEEVYPARIASEKAPSYRASNTGAAWLDVKGAVWRLIKRDDNNNTTIYKAP